MTQHARLALLCAVSLTIFGCARPEPEPTVSTTGSAANGVVTETPTQTGANVAVAQLQGREGTNVAGVATFTQTTDGVNLVIEVEGMDPGPKGLHIHENGQCTQPTFESAGGHWDPTGHDHGALGHTAEAHKGDIGNIEIGSDGRGRLEFSTDRWTIGGSEETNIIGKALVIHASQDDLRTQPTGDSGDRMGCGVIQER
jgi:superoxide dismutase, Cu-Zn family